MSTFVHGPAPTGADAGILRCMNAPDVCGEVARLGGVARVATLRDRRVTRTVLDRAVAQGDVVRVRRGWVALPDADRLLVAAARHSVVITCVTLARRLGIWVHDPDPGVHVAAAPGSTGGKPTQFHVHWARPLVPRHPDALVDSVENVLALIAQCQPYEQALAAWDSALNKRLVDVQALQRYPLRTAARRLLTDVTPFADAGLETYLRPRLQWLRLPLRIQAWIAGHRVDALVGARLVLQIDGAQHTGPQRSEDIRHDAQLQLRGYHVIRISYPQMMYDWPSVQDAIMRAVAQGLHLP